MSWFEGARARFNLLFARRAAESRMNEEVGFHIDMETDRLVREQGMSRDDARRRALVTFGGVTQHKETLRDGRGFAWLGGMSLDAKLALRLLLKNPGLTLVAVIGMSVAVTIGAVAFSAIYTMLDASLPVNDGRSVIAIRNIDTDGRVDARATHLHDLALWRTELRSVRELGAYRIVERNLITGDGAAESVRIAEMTASGFRIARVPPLLGRYFIDEDEREGAPQVVVIGYDVWQRRFAAREDVVGQSIQLGDERHTIIGVMPKGFAFPVNNRVWTPLRLNTSDYARGDAPSIEVFARLAPGATIESARREAATISQRLASSFPETHAHLRTRIVAYTRMFIDNSEAPWMFHLIQLLVTMLLVVIGTNVAVLVYARTASRMGEIAVRTALGASRGRVVAQLFAEALALSGVAAVIGLFAAHFALQQIDAALTRMQGEAVPFWLRFHITPGVILYCGGLAVLGAVIVGVVPGLKATGRHVRSSLQHLSSGGSGIRLGKTWTLMIIAQVTVAVAVLPVAIAGIAAYGRLRSAQAELASRQILTATLFFDEPQTSTQRLAAKRTVFRKIATLGAARPDASRDDDFAARYTTLRSDLVGRLRAEAGVTEVVFASNAPGDESTTRIETDRADPAATPDGSNGVVTGATRVDLDYFHTLEIPILAGRGFDASDIAAGERPIIVNRSFVRKAFGGSNPLGHRLRVASVRSGANRDAAAPAPWETIVGVVPDFPVDSSSLSPKVYRPLSPADLAPVSMAVRVKGMTAVSFTNRLRALTIATSPMLRLEGIKSLDQALYDSSADTRIAILVLELITASTLLLSAAGIYALMAFTITRRRREIGIRAALGAGPRRVLMSVLSRVFAQIVIGIVIGIGVAGALDKALAGGWTGRRPALVLPGVVAFMALVGLVAAIGPASRALRIQPTEALKAD